MKTEATFDREIWKLTMDWLCTGEHGLPEDPEKRGRITSAAQRDADIAQVDAWRAQVQSVPDWALKVDRATPHWGIEICNEAWLTYLEAQLRKISEGIWWPSVGWCGGASLARQQWALWAVEALSGWLDNGSPDRPNPLTADIAALLGESNPDKVGAVRLLKATLELGITKPPRQFDAYFEKLEATSPLADVMRPKIKYLEFRCGYRWEQIVLEMCRAIGDAAYRQGEPRFWHVGTCNGQIAFAHRDDPLRIPTTAGILIGLWAWLKAVPVDNVRAAYPEFAVLSARVREQLGERTPVKRWLAGRLFVGVRAWLQEYDHGDLAPPRPALEIYPTLSPCHPERTRKT